ncbi:MAG: hypothetical protein Q4F17_12640 [Eubacteriales bacterium]|nr:hypothetical protein [Eubacteriales bacterium]
MKKNNLDEAQEQKMLQIEHNAYGIAFWGLLAAIVIQQLLDGGNDRSILGEIVVFLTMCFYVLIACLKNGIWDRRLRPSGRVNLIASLCSGLCVGVLWGIISYRNYHNPLGSLLTAVCMLLSTFALTLAALSITTSIFKKRQKRLEAEMEE